ncbi:MAG: hypothetical protein AAF651_04130, partial [Cyanobacteria bacterium P01_C01_bin.73]
MKLKRSFFKEIKPTRWSRRAARIARGVAGAAIAIALGMGNLAALAGDPFRSGDGAKDIGINTEAAFEALFFNGNYDLAADKVADALQTEADDP